ncbi:MAG: 50S ribosomal protein L11 methyltransferase [Alphaproteobacteria bacterium]|nr:50S ribosomal protein L11 methyltransferase [Alphaproteobacteria bacterium]
MTGSATPPSWKVEVIVPTVAGDAIADAVETHISAVSMFPAPPGDVMRICGYVAAEPDAAALKADIATAAHTAGIATPELDIVCLPATDWAAVNRESFAPLRVGGFWIRDSYHDDPAPAGTVTLIVDAATAFGTGHHPTTQGCLIALDHFANRPRLLQPGPVLDMGCGTGILGMAAALRLRRPVVATDIDPVAVAMARYNVEMNRLGAVHRPIVSRGYADHAILRAGPYALILANILARPIARMAPDCARHLKPGGYAVLSGLLTTQERPVIAAHRQQGLILTARHRIEVWSTLVVRRPI